MNLVKVGKNLLINMISNDKIDLLHSKSKKYKNIVDVTLNRISDIFKNHKKISVSLSGGKDSVVMLDLCVKVNLNVECFFNYLNEYDVPGTLELVKNYCNKLNVKLHICPPTKSVQSYFDQFGIEGDFGNIPLEEPLKMYLLKQKPDLCCIGLRKEESKRRNIFLNLKGSYFYCKKYKIFQLYPIENWKVQDIYTYMFMNELPLHEHYNKMQKYFKRNNIRISWLISGDFLGRGEVDIVKKIYPEQYNLLCKQFDVLKLY